MKKQGKLTALLTSFVMVLAAAGSTGAATLAWFTRGTEAVATGFDFTASAASGILISTDAETWKSNITNLDFDTTTPGGAQEGNRISINGMDPVSTVDSVSSGELSFYSATYDSTSGGFTLAADTSNYLVFDLYFLNQGAEDLTLSLTSAATVTDGTTDQDTALSSRVAFIVEGSDNDATAAVALSGGTSAYIWEPNSTTRAAATAPQTGLQNNAKYYYNGISGDNGSTPVTAKDSYNMLSAGAYTTLVNTTKDYAIGDSPVVGTLQGSTNGRITKVKVYVWMEGQDVDNTNAASSGMVDIALAFDSGAATTTLADKTADSFSDATTLAVTGTDETGATYNAYVLLTATDTNSSLDYISVISSGSVTESGSGVASITLGTAVPVGTYDVVVTARLTGSIGSRTSTSIEQS